MANTLSDANRPTLGQYLQGRKPKGFTPKVHYFKDGDYATFFASNERCRESRQDDLVTVYLSVTTGEMVGCKIKGVKRILNRLGAFKVEVTKSPVTLSLLFVGAALIDPNAGEEYASLCRQLPSNAILSPEHVESAIAA